MRVNANAVLRSWTLLAAFGGSYAPVIIHVMYYRLCVHVPLAVCAYCVLSRGEVVVSTDEREGIVYGDIDLAQVDSVRSQIPVTSQKRWDLYSITDKTQN